MAEKNLFIYILVRLGLEPYNICTNPETGETPLEGRLCVYILQLPPKRRAWGITHTVKTGETPLEGRLCVYILQK